MQCWINPKYQCFIRYEIGTGLWDKFTCENCETFIKSPQTKLIGEKKQMPLKFQEPRQNVKAIKASDFEQGITVTFKDEGRDIEAPQGQMYLYIVDMDNQERGLWIRPSSARAIALSPLVPLLGKTVHISKTGEGKGTRYVAEEVTQKIKKR